MKQKILWTLLFVFTFSVAVAQDNNDILLADDFEAGILAQWRYDTTLSLEMVEEFGNTFLSITSGDDWGGISSVTGEDWENYSFQFRFRVVDFDSTSSTPHFFFDARSSTRGAYSGFIWMREQNSYMALSGSFNGTWGNLQIDQMDFGSPANPQMATWHKVEMIVNANTIELYFDDVWYARYSEPDLSRGGIGFSLAPGVSVHIDDVKVISVDEIEPVEIAEIVESTVEILDDSVVVDGETFPFSSSLINPLTGETIQPGIYEPTDMYDETTADYFNWYVCPGCVTWDYSRVQRIEPIVVAGYVGRTEGIVFNRQPSSSYEVIIPAKDGQGWAITYIHTPGARVILSDTLTGEVGVYGQGDGNPDVGEDGVVKTWSSTLDSGELALFLIGVGSEAREHRLNELQNLEIGQFTNLGAAHIVIAQDTLPTNAEVAITAPVNVNIRNEPNTRSSVMGRVVANEPVTVIREVLNGEVPNLGSAFERTGIWYEVETTEGVTGYVWSGLMDEPVITDFPEN